MARFILNDNGFNEKTLQSSLDSRHIDFDYDDELRLVISDDNSERVEQLLYELGIDYEIYEGGDYSYTRYLLSDADEELGVLLDKAGIDYDFDSGDRIMIPSNQTVEAEKVFYELGINFDMI